MITLRGIVCKSFAGIVAVALTMGVHTFGQTKSAPVDPGVRGGPAGAGTRRASAHAWVYGCRFGLPKSVDAHG